MNILSNLNPSSKKTASKKSKPLPDSAKATTIKQAYPLDPEIMKAVFISSGGPYTSADVEAALNDE